jgi:hypothetical protein
MHSGAKPLTNWFELSLSLAVAIAVISSPIRRPSSLLTPPNFLRRNFADCCAHHPTDSSLIEESISARPIAGLRGDEEKKGDGSDAVMRPLGFRPGSLFTHLWASPKPHPPLQTHPLRC